ncbi:MAG TPA: M48 family metallopeptidase, partial [Cytophagales bacterium]
MIRAGYCQPSFQYSPANYSAEGAPVQQYLAQAHQKELAALPKRYRSELEKIYKDRHEHLTGSLREEQFIFSPLYTGYFDGVLAEIRRANPQLGSQSVHLLVSRDPTPNATCLGNGIITFTIGLLRRVENDSQVAFVLCHELAHQHLGHVQQSIQQYVEKQNNANTRREIERIAASENRRVEQATGLLRSLVYEHTRYSRIYETAADSLALVYLKNTRYNPQEALRVLALLDTVDRSKYPGPLDLKPVFDSPAYPFRDAWLQA